MKLRDVVLTIYYYTCTRERDHILIISEISGWWKGEKGEIKEIKTVIKLTFFDGHHNRKHIKRLFCEIWIIGEILENDTYKWNEMNRALGHLCAHIG